MSERKNIQSLLQSLINKDYNKEEITNMLNWFNSQHAPRTFGELDQGNRFTAEYRDGKEYIKTSNNGVIIYGDGIGESESFSSNHNIEITNAQYDIKTII